MPLLRKGNQQTRLEFDLGTPFPFSALLHQPRNIQLKRLKKYRRMIAWEEDCLLCHKSEVVLICDEHRQSKPNDRTFKLSALCSILCTILAWSLLFVVQLYLLLLLLLELQQIFFLAS